MPTSSPPDRPRPARFPLRIASALLLTLVAASAPAQTLAHPGWVGNGIAIESWWQHAVFYKVSAGQPGELSFAELTKRLDALRALGIDALVLPAPELPAPGSNGPMPNLDDLDVLLRQASSRGMRVLLTIQPAAGSSDLASLARFWLNRGVAGLHIATPPETSPEAAAAMVDSVRKLSAGTAGQRVVLSDVAPPTDSAPASRPARKGQTNRVATQLQIDSRTGQLSSIDAASLRQFLAQDMTKTNLLLDLQVPRAQSGAAAGDAPPLAQALATVTLLLRPTVLIDSTAGLILQPTPEQPEVAEESDQPAKPAIPKQAPPGVYLPYVPYVPPQKPHKPAAVKLAPPDPLTVWYQQLDSLHHSNAALRTGAKIFLDHDAQNVLAWVNRPASPSLQNPPVVVLCNLSSSPVELSLADDMKKLNLHGFFLRPLLRSDNGMGAQDIEAVKLAPYAVYIGELRR